ncbi:MAG: ACT domain-containing protein [Acholeplasmatales bacterium]|nr:ACT domain-containing protein [Acholeplasmatales bacterium]
MKKIAILGPKGTYSELAADKYVKNLNEEYEYVYYPTILKAIDAVDENTIAVVPYENSLDGFIIETLDRIMLRGLNISKQIKISIDFAFVANVSDIKDVKNTFCQFKSYGQCLGFLSDKNFKVTKTESNIESYDLLMASSKGNGAVIPMHALKEGTFPLEVKHISDRSNNETRFVVLDNNSTNEIGDNIECSLVFNSIHDRPGILYEILSKFHDANINLKSIMSRPDKTGMGNYNFFIECSLSKNERDEFKKILDEYRHETNFKVDVLGVYESLGE